MSHEYLKMLICLILVLTDNYQIDSLNQSICLKKNRGNRDSKHVKESECAGLSLCKIYKNAKVCKINSRHSEQQST